MFIREIWGKFNSFIFFEILKSPSFHSGDFKKSELSKFIPNFPLKHLITSRYLQEMLSSHDMQCYQAR